MLPESFKLSPKERNQRAVAKQATVLHFLASGEQWTTLQMAADLLQVTERTALRTLQKMVEEKLLKADTTLAKYTKANLYGISDHGLAVANLYTVKAFYIGRVNPSYINHHLEGQIVRIKAERNGWIDWVPGKALYVNNTKRLKKLPDSLATRPDGRRVAIEFERFVKTPKRLADVMGGHLSQIVEGKYDAVYYFTPQNRKGAQQRAFDRIEFVIVEGKKIKLNDSHRSRFKVFETEKWKGEM